MKPKVSIIIPIYGVAKYLRQALDSVVNQTYTNTEIILVNDASPYPEDERICKDYASTYSNIIYIKHSINKRAGGARNTGLKIANGEYICFVDGDDYLEPNMIETLVLATENGKYDVVICNYNVVDEDGKPIPDPYNLYKFKVIFNPRQQDFFMLTNPDPWNKLWRKNLFIENSIWFPEGVLYEDLATTPRVLFYAKNIKIIPDRLYNYRRRDDAGSSLSTTFSKDSINDLIKVYELLRNFLQEQGLWTGKYISYFYNMVLTFTKSHLMHAKRLLSYTDYKRYSRAFIEAIKENLEFVNKF